MRIGFVLNHYEPNQVPHVAPTAFALSRLRPDWHVEIMCSTAAEAHFAADIAILYRGERAVTSRLRVPLYARALDPLVSQAMAREPRPILPPEFVQIAELDGRPVAIIVLVPNVNEALRRLGGRLVPTGWARLLWQLKVAGVGSARFR